MTDIPEDIQLKFDGGLVKELGGAPAELVIASLTALQRMVFIIGMRSQGRSLGQRLKPPQWVRREYAVVCRAPKPGSHLQPFGVTSEGGLFTPAAAQARTRLLGVLKAFDSASDKAVEEAIPNARERWFLADAAAGLLPLEQSDVQVTLRAGAMGPFAFKADRARSVIQRFRAGSPPPAEEEELIGRLRAIDYEQTIITVKPPHSRAVRVDYPGVIEAWLQANVRRQVSLIGDPNVNAAGDITGFNRIVGLRQIEPSLEPITEFASGGRTIIANPPLELPVTFTYEDGFFCFQDELLGIDAYADDVEKLREEVLAELDVLWRKYAEASDNELAADAQRVKQALIQRFEA